MRKKIVVVRALVAGLMLPGAAWGATFGFVDEFAGPGTNGWGGGTPTSNPGTGGVGGAGDGYLLLEQGFAGFLGARSLNFNYQGDWTVAGIDKLTLYLNDVGDADPLEIHFLISDNPLSTTWQYNVGFSPPQGCWQKFTVDLSSGANWTRTRGGASFEEVLAGVERVTIRHDLAPYIDFPDGLAGDFGVDRITLGHVPPTCSDPFADADDDGDSDMVDFGLFQACWTGVCGGLLPGCECFDHDDDGDVDADDFAAFEACFSGPGIPADPSCDGP